MANGNALVEGGCAGSATGNATCDVADVVSNVNFCEFALMDSSSKTLGQRSIAPCPARSKFGLDMEKLLPIRGASVPAGSRNRPTSVLAGSRNRPTSVPASSRNRPTSVPAGSRNRPTSVPAGSRNRPTSVPAGSRNLVNYICPVENPHKNRDLGIVDSGCSRSMTLQIEKLWFSEFQEGTISTALNLSDIQYLAGKVPNISHLKPFRCLMTILNTSDHLGKFEGKADEGFIVEYAAHIDESFLVMDGEPDQDYAEELARLKKQAYEANATTENHLSQADLAASRNRVLAGKIDSAAGVSYGPTETSTPVVTPVHIDAPSLSSSNSLGQVETFFKIYLLPLSCKHHVLILKKWRTYTTSLDTGIFSFSSYDDDFGGTITNLAPSIIVDSVPTKRVKTIHPHS
ncbi:hypothetical protein Tco_0316540 [Tanacetum coccineum]